VAEAALGSPIRIDADVEALVDEGGENRRLVLQVAEWPGFAPGQFVMLSPGPRGEVPRSDPLLPRPMAVYRAQSRGAGARVEILFKRHGRGTTLLSESLPGQRVGLVGPLGRPFADPLPGERPLLVAGGTGIASVFELAARFFGRGMPVEVLLGARSAEDLMGEKDFAELGVTLQIATEDGSRGHRGLVTGLLEASLALGGDARVYACGPTAMMQKAAEIASAHGHACVVSLENPMACGFGVCLGCAAPLREGGYALVCREGPVFDASRVDWEHLA